MSNELQVWLSFNNEATPPLQLPVNPESIRVSSTRGYEDVMTTQLGEYTIAGTDNLNEYTLTSFFPRDYNSSYCEYEAIPLPYAAVAEIEGWAATKRPIRFTVPGIINTPATIRSFTYEERAGHPGDVWFELSLKEYHFVEFKHVSTKKAGVVTILSANSKRANSRGSVKSYKVMSGDTLSKIAFKVYTDGDRWREIYTANKTLIGANPNLIRVGQTLVIP